MHFIHVICLRIDGLLVFGANFSTIYGYILAGSFIDGIEARGGDCLERIQTQLPCEVLELATPELIICLKILRLNFSTQKLAVHGVY